MEEKSQKDKIEQEKDIERQNNENIKKLIDIIGIHIESGKTKEYLQFVKEVRKYRKKINNKKEKLEDQDMLETAYREKNGSINGKISDIASTYNYDKIDPWYARVSRVIDVETKKEEINRYYIPYEYTPAAIRRYIRMGNYQKQYIEQGEWGTPGKCFVSEALSCKLIQEHYNILNAYFMNEVLEHYDNELEYWKHYLKQMVKKIEKIEELE